MSSPILTKFSNWARCQCLVKLTSTMMSNNQPTELTVAGGLRPGSTDRPTGVAEVGTGPDLHRGSSLSQASRRLSGSQPWHALEWHATHSFSHLNLQHEPHENAAVWPDPCLWACNLKSKRPPRGVWLLFLHALVDKDGQIRLHGQSGDENQLGCAIRSHSYRWPAERVLSSQVVPNRIPAGPCCPDMMVTPSEKDDVWTGPSGGARSSQFGFTT